MREDKEILEEIKPFGNGNVQYGRVSLSERIIIELLLDIRRLLSPKEK